MNIAAHPDTDEFLRFANQLADAARPIAREYFRQPLAVESKADLSPVTIADRTIEIALRQMIESRYPDHGILGEEFSARQGNHLTWVLDPIDGTRSFITGMPLFGTLIALLQDGRPMLGVIDFPALSERWTGVTGQATRHQGNVVRTSAVGKLAEASCYSTSPDMFTDEDVGKVARLGARLGMRRFGGDCYAYALLASGHCDLVVEAGLQPYDYLSLVPVIEGAGGRISDWQGRALTLDSDGRVLAAANPALWEQALAVLG